MGEPKLSEDKKAGNLSATAKTYLKQLRREEMYERPSFFESK